MAQNTKFSVILGKQDFDSCYLSPVSADCTNLVRAAAPATNNLLRDCFLPMLTFLASKILSPRGPTGDRSSDIVEIHVNFAACWPAVGNTSCRLWLHCSEGMAIGIN